MTRLNTQFSVKGISLLNSVMASSSSVQFKKFLFNQVDDIAGNEVSPTKQARGDSGKEPKLHWWQNGEKNLVRNQASSVTWFFRNHSNILIHCSRNISDYYQWWKQLCCFIFLWKLHLIFQDFLLNIIFKEHHLFGLEIIWSIINIILIYLLYIF